MDKHTPTTWERSGTLIVKDLSYDKTVTASHYEIATTRIGHWTSEEAEANAAFIVRAVNAHEAMLTALKGLIDAIHEGPERILRKDEIEAIIKARTAIAKAEGK